MVSEGPTVIFMLSDRSRGSLLPLDMCMALWSKYGLKHQIFDDTRDLSKISSILVTTFAVQMVSEGLTAIFMVSVGF